jgi:alpha-1,6-mannosyltransferase
VRPARTRSRHAASAELAVVAIVTTVLAVVVLAGITPSSPYSWKLIPGDGPAAPLAAVSRSLGLGSLSITAAGVVGIVVMALGIVAFLYCLRVAWRGELSVRTVLGLAIAFQVIFAALPLVFSQDVFSYAMYARIGAIYHQNPYVVTPTHFPKDPIYPYVGWGWRSTPAVYGPAFTLLSEGLARFIHDPLALVVSFKLLAAAAGIGTLLIITWVARRLAPGRAAFAVALFGWNPAIWAYATGGGHNDMLVALAVAGAFALLVRARDEVDPGRRRWELGAIVVLTLGSLIKVSIAPALVLAVVASIALGPAGKRLGLFAREAGVVAVLTIAFAAPFWQTHDPSLGLYSLVSHRDWSSPVRFLLATVGGLGDLIAGHTGRSVMEVLVRIAVAAAGIYALIVVATSVAKRASRSGTPAANGDTVLAWTPKAEGASWAWILLVFTLVSPVVLPWYLAWSLPVAWLMARGGRNAVVLVSVVLAATHTVSRPSLVPRLWNDMLIVGHDIIGPLLFLVLVWLVVALEKMRRVDAPLEDPDLVPAFAAPSRPVPASSAAG